MLILQCCKIHVLKPIRILKLITLDVRLLEEGPRWRPYIRVLWRLGSSMSGTSVLTTITAHSGSGSSMSLHEELLNGQKAKIVPR